MNEESKQLLPRKEQNERLLLDHVAVMFGKNPNEKETMTLRTFHRKDTLYFSNNSHGRKDRWKIRMFIPKNPKNQCCPKLCFQTENSIKELKMIDCTKSENDVFDIFEFIYSNPQKTKKQPHQVLLMHNHQQHYLFSLYVFAGQCSKSIYLPDFWEILVIETFFIHWRDKKNETNNEKEEILILWGAVFKCLQYDTLDNRYIQLYESKNNLPRFLLICKEILGNDLLEDYLNYMFNSPFFLLMFVFFIPGLIDGLSENDLSAFQQTFNNTVVSYASQPASEMNIISTAFACFSKEDCFVKKFETEQDKYLTTLKQTAMGTVSHMASINSHHENIEMFRSVLKLLNCINKTLKTTITTPLKIEETRSLQNSLKILLDK